VNQDEYITVLATHPFRFKEILVYLTRSPEECLYKVVDNRVYRWIKLVGENLLLEIRNREDQALDIYFPDRTPSSMACEAAVAYVREWFDLDTDLVPFYGMMRRDDLLKHLVDCYKGLRLVGVPDLFEAAGWAIIGQQINLTFAYALKKRLVESYGVSLGWEGKHLWMFPEPEIVANLTVQDLMKLQFTRRKAEYLIGVAQKICNGTLSKSRMLQDLGAARQQLMQIRGIGPWTAEYVLMRCLRDHSAFPVQDVGLHNAIKYLRGSATKPSIEEVQEIGACWGRWKAYATFYLWRSLINPSQGTAT
jgi:DNA-3-methyladenine glycosylase II